MSAPGRIAPALALRGVWRGGELERASHPAVPTGHATLDRELPGGGWPTGVLTEVLHDGEGLGEVTFLATALRGAAGAHRLIAWVSPPHLPYAPALAGAGLPLERCLVVRPASHEDALWSAEQAMRSGACGALLFWIERLARDLDYAWLRRLQISADAGRCLAVLYRSAAASSLPTPAHLRVALSVREGRLLASIPKRRGPPIASPIPIAGSAEPGRVPRTSEHACLQPVPEKRLPALGS